MSEANIVESSRSPVQTEETTKGSNVNWREELFRHCSRMSQKPSLLVTPQTIRKAHTGRYYIYDLYIILTLLLIIIINMCSTSSIKPSFYTLPIISSSLSASFLFFYLSLSYHYYYYHRHPLFCYMYIYLRNLIQFLNQLPVHNH